jgi:uncharacterized protein YdeI (BOF family)
MKKLFSSFFVVIFALVFYNNTNAQVVTVAEILANPGNYQGQPLLLDGKVTEWRDDDGPNGGDDDDGIFDDNTGTIHMDFQEGNTPQLQEQIFVLGFLDQDDGNWEIDVSYWWNSSNPPPVIVPDPTTVAAVLAAYPGNRGNAVLLIGENTATIPGETDEFVFEDNSTGQIRVDFQDGAPKPPLNVTYKLIGIVEDENGNPEIDVYAWDYPTSVEDIGGTLPLTFEISQNYPNPFNPSTKIRFSITQSEQVVINVFNIQGELVEALVDGVMDAGNYQITFDGSGLASGLYLYRIQAGSFIETKKMTLMK